MRIHSFVYVRGDPIEVILVAGVLIVVAVTFLAVALKMQSTVRIEKRTYGIPDGLILYSDLNVPAEPLFSKRFHLVGKPDFIVQKEDRYLPVEVKTGGQPHPQPSHLMQLAAYCQILEDVSGAFVPEGILVYNNVPYTIAFDPQLRFELESVITLMRTSLHEGVVMRNHQEPGRCKRCSMRRYCDDHVQ
jgi:CRISPR-associated exonuclease Cas4